MSSITFQHHLPLLPSNTSLIIAAASDNAPTIKPPNFGQIPSWLSLKTAPSSLKTPQQNQPGKVENLHLVSLSKQEKLKEARAFLEQMGDAGVSVRPYSFECLLQACSNLKSVSDGRYFHHRLRETVKNPSGFLQNSVLRMYCDCGSLVEAQKMFDEMIERTLVSWLIIISAYAEAGFLNKSFRLFSDMIESGIEPNSLDLNLGRQIHGFVVKLGLESDVSVGTPLVDFYVKCSSFESACRAFERIREPSDVSWSAMICGYCQNGKFEDSVKIFKSLRSKEDLSASLPERKEQLLDHSERLAISFGLISTPTNAPIVIFKNLRACKDCHEFAKHVSAVTGRKIVVRDATRFHHFHSGQCSCNDYW
ncbi:hypothetical protein Patl1_17025 [Pistacia atlantica]|uniref:Uncharacterized protein n=1 Tax=Pistacia atlantica TaxID=434234 RepID=A0ACC1B6F0_9ROSI|nr:hypothetical protein Patl1_17025 [Pistacia atlantica]